MQQPSLCGIFLRNQKKTWNTNLTKLMSVLFLASPVDIGNMLARCLLLEPCVRAQHLTSALSIVESRFTSEKLIILSWAHFFWKQHRPSDLDWISKNHNKTVGMNKPNIELFMSFQTNKTGKRTKKTKDCIGQNTKDLRLAWRGSGTRSEPSCNHRRGWPRCRTCPKLRVWDAF